MTWLQRSDSPEELETLFDEEYGENEWIIGQHPLQGLEDFMEDLFPSLTFPYSQTSLPEISAFEVSAIIRSGHNLKQSNVLTSASDYDQSEQEFLDAHLQHQFAAPIQEDNNDQTIYSGHGASTPEASPCVRSYVNRGKAHLRQLSTQTVASNFNSSKQVHIQNQPTTLNGSIPRSIGNPWTPAAHWWERERDSNRSTSFSTLSSNAQEAKYTDERFSSGISNFTAGVPEQRKKGSLSSSALLSLRQRARRRQLRTAQAPSETGYARRERALCTKRVFTSQYAKSNERCNKLRAMGLSNREILRYLMEENWHGYKPEDMETTQDSNGNNSTMPKKTRKET
nr:hypothetical protein HmN_000779100 [Hymenolepis microstoma]